MTITERFDHCLERQARIEVLEAELKALRDENAADRGFVLDWFRSHKPLGGSSRGLIYSKRTQRRLDVTEARKLLGAKAKDAEKTIELESLKCDPEAVAKLHPQSRLRSVAKAG